LIYEFLDQVQAKIGAKVAATTAVSYSIKVFKASLRVNVFLTFWMLDLSFGGWLSKQNISFSIFVSKIKTYSRGKFDFLYLECFSVGRKIGHTTFVLSIFSYFRFFNLQRINWSGLFLNSHGWQLTSLGNLSHPNLLYSFWIFIPCETFIMNQ